MKKLLIVTLIIVGFGVQAQNPAQQDAKAKLQAARIALITERLGLTPEQAQQFWPIYNEYAEQRREIQNQFRQTRQGVNVNELTEEQRQEMIRSRMEMKQKQLNLESQYGERLMQVITSRQLMALKKAEDDFKKMIVRRIEQRRQQQLQQQQMLLQRERKLRQGNN
ncbi:MAG: Spy/CpxP family protein refolding chaperone [Bacteroidota bacterium]